MLSINDNAAYVSSALIDVEMFFVLVSILFAFIYSAMTFVFLLSRNWKSLRTSATNLIIGVGVSIAAVATDAPTLIYMT